MSFRNNKAGFTILELLVAATVTVILAGIMIAMITNLMGAWNRTSGALSANREAQLALNVLAEDLQHAVYRHDGAVWMVATIEASANLNVRGWEDDTNEKPDEVELIEDEFIDNRYGKGGTWLRFFTKQMRPYAGHPSQPTAVAYQIVRRPVTTAPDAESRYILYRSEVRPHRPNPAEALASNNRPGSFDVGYDLDPDPNNPYYDNTVEDNDGTARDPYNVTLPPRDYVLANDVIDFGVRMYTRDGTGNLELLFPETNSHTRYLAGDENHGPTDPDLDVFPDVVDIFIRVLTPRGAQLIQNYETAPGGVVGTQDWWEIAEENSHIFTRRVHLQRQ